MSALWPSFCFFLAMDNGQSLSCSYLSCVWELVMESGEWGGSSLMMEAHCCSDID